MTTSTWYQDHLKRAIADAGVIITTTHRGNDNIIIRQGFANGKHTLMLTYSKAATYLDRVNDPDASIVLQKSYTDRKKLDEWFKKIETINKMGLRKLQTITNKNLIVLPSSKRYGSRLYWTGECGWKDHTGQTVHYFVLIGPKRGEGYRLHHYAGYLNEKRQLHHVREPASRPFAYTEKEALAAVAASLKNGPPPVGMKTS